MKSRTISVKEEVYVKLSRKKRKNESFNDLLERLVSSNSSLEALEEIRGSVEIEDKDSFLQEVYKRRSEWR